MAKRNLKAGDKLDGEGGYTVYGRLMPAAASLACGGLPIGLAHGVCLQRDVAKGSVVGWQDVGPIDNEAARFRREMEKLFAAEASPRTAGTQVPR
jgi:predicted homoserine dehydrogenase-like protein